MFGSRIIDFEQGRFFSVYAAEPSKVVRHVEYDEITDVNQLLQMGIEEYQKTPKVRNQSENEEITVKQLLSITEYDDGTIEKRVLCYRFGHG